MTRPIARWLAALASVLALTPAQAWAADGADSDDCPQAAAAGVPGDYGAPPATLLVSDPSLPFKLRRARQGDTRVTLLAYGPAGAAQVGVQLAAQLTGNDTRTCIDLSPAAQAAWPLAMRIAVTEHVYALVLGMDAYAGYCVRVQAADCTTAGSRVTHAQALRQLARERERLRQDGSSSDGRFKRWQTVMLQPLNAAPEPDAVAASVFDEQGPLVGVPLYFHRAPHAGCTGRSDSSGAVRCTLVDQHGDDDQHDHAATPLLVTFAGDLRADRTLLPTTLVVQPRARGATGPAE